MMARVKRLGKQLVVQKTVRRSPRPKIGPQTSRRKYTVRLNEPPNVNRAPATKLTESTGSSPLSTVTMSRKLSLVQIDQSVLNALNENSYNSSRLID
jgi:hypothetical protein